jgi:hypothetical protein
MMRHFLMHGSAVLLLLFLASACSIQVDSTCADPFRTEKASDSSLPDVPHIPIEAQPTATVTVPSSAGPAQSPGVTTPDACPHDARVLPTEIVVSDAVEYYSKFLLSPSGNQMALRTQDTTIVLDLSTDPHRQIAETMSFPLAWTGEHSLIFHQDELHFYELDLNTGRRTPFEMRWEYNEVDENVFAAPFYTGWQAAWQLELGKESICAAVHDGKLRTSEAADGTLLLFRDDLLEHGGNLIRESCPSLLHYDEVADLRMKAQRGSSVLAIMVDAPIRHGYWHHTLVLTGLPDDPYNLLVNVNSESHWMDYPFVENQLPIHGAIEREIPANGRFLVERDPCADPSDKNYPFLLYQTAVEGQALVFVGRIPYDVSDYWGDMVWSPDGQHIYFKHAIDGRYVISRLTLPTPFEPLAALASPKRKN